MNSKRLETGMTDATTHPPKDLQTAITELVLDLKGDGKIETLAEKLNMSRNRLAKIFQAYQKKMKGEEPLEVKPWGLDSLERIAHELNICVSDVIIAAEDVQNGLPPWFHYRISKNAGPGTHDRLANIILEAAGCYTYGDSDPMNVKGIRKSLKYGFKNRTNGDNAYLLLITVKNMLKSEEWEKVQNDIKNFDNLDVLAYRSFYDQLPHDNCNDSKSIKSLFQAICNLQPEQTRASIITQRCREIPISKTIMQQWDSLKASDTSNKPLIEHKIVTSR